MASIHDEESPLLADQRSNTNGALQVIKFGSDDKESPRNWSSRQKLANVAIIASMAILSPLTSSMFTPGIQQIAKDLGTTKEAVISITTANVIMLGVGPLLLAPLSETFGRRVLYISCFTIFAILQIPTALSKNIQMLIALRAISGLFGSVGLANGGGTISDMYEARERAGIFGYYLLGPLLGPTIGPLFGGIIISRLGWRWMFWIMAVVCSIISVGGYFFLKETYAPVLLRRRRDSMRTTRVAYRIEGEDDRSLWSKLRSSLKRPLVIFKQPIVHAMSLYQALIFGTTFSIFTNLQDIFAGPPYNFNSEQIGLLYLGPGLGFLTSAILIVPRIDTVYNKLTKKHNGKALPEYRLPLANIGSVLIPGTLFWFAWSTEKKLHWLAIIASTYFYGLGQVVVFNTVQNYYIDSFEKYAASAIAAGSVFRSLVGGFAPVLAPTLLDNLGYGWGISVFAFVGVSLAPIPIVFYYYGKYIRERFPLDL